VAERGGDERGKQQGEEDWVHFVKYSEKLRKRREEERRILVVSNATTIGRRKLQGNSKWQLVEQDPKWWSGWLTTRAHKGVCFLNAGQKQEEEERSPFTKTNENHTHHFFFLNFFFPTEE
jgi:hypothetical protein